MSDQGGPPAGDAGTAAASERVAAILEQAAHVQLDVVVIAPPNEIRTDARARATDAARAAGRGPLLDQAVEAARERADRGFAAGGYSGNWAATDMSISVARSPDRVAAAAALEEAVTAAVVEDLVDAETVETLEVSWRRLADFRSMPAPGSLSNLGSSIASTHGTSRAVAIVVIVIAAVVLLSGLTALGVGLLAVGVVLAWRAFSGGRGVDPGA